ncbi:GNAT family N-acetyltransferase [Shewanella profunda]|uniref:GNAT family N-acetyltransferase n=1 Tax=Shewanella profunda TaxID=254793 RepID=UPI0020103988|nr:GNAT family N-acetyltransferase [Shewanella profunda]MCL1091643.1 GNAT family N-acetyltransferase [Shewanella profunda]
MSSLQIRQAEIQDLKAIEYLLLQLGYSSTQEQLQKYLEKSERTDEIYIAEEEGNIIGLISLIFFDYFPAQQKICRITALVVAEAYRGSGVGTRLIRFSKARAFEYGCSKLEVTTSMRREKTQAYYEAIGFEKTSFRYIQDVATY